MVFVRGGTAEEEAFLLKTGTKPSPTSYSVECSTPSLLMSESESPESGTEESMVSNRVFAESLTGSTVPRA